MVSGRARRRDRGRSDRHGLSVPCDVLARPRRASVARVLERISAVDPTVRVVDTHPLAANDPNGLDLFYRMLVATIIGFITVFQALAQAGRLALRRNAAFVLGLAVAASFGLTLVGGARGAAARIRCFTTGRVGHPRPAPAGRWRRSPR
jgi:hypothetical protein